MGGRLHNELKKKTDHISLLDPISPKRTLNVCVGKEWYRFPSHFFVPTERTTGSVTDAQIAFLESDFDGQLPKLFTLAPPPNNSSPSSSSSATSHVHPWFNDRNQRQNDRYIKVDECDYIVDLDLKAQNEPHYYEEMPGMWRVLDEQPFLDATSSMHTISRAFYVPWFSSKHNVYASYQLLERIKSS